MKKITQYLMLIIILPASFVFAQQNYYTFSELRGMEDQIGNTHLFYRMYYTRNNASVIVRENSVHHLDIESGADTLFLIEHTYQDSYQSDFSYVSDYQFWNKNPSEYICCGSGAAGQDIILHAYVRRFDDKYGIVFYGSSFSSSLAISQQNDSLVFADIGSSCISTDGGKSWDTLNTNFKFISLSPFNDKIMFGIRMEGGLYKSIDRGKDFYSVDTGAFNPQRGKMFYSMDNTNMYYLEDGRLLSSDNNGEPFSWTQIYNSSNNIYISPDSTPTGGLFLADGNKIFLSNDYGKTFNFFKKLDGNIVGIYKKLASNKLYAATKYNIIEISNDSVKILKSLPIDPEILRFYPLAKGNKWIYNHHSVDYATNFPSYLDTVITREVTGDTVMKNGEKYFIVKDFYNQIKYERIDSTSGKIFRFAPDSLITDSEYVIDDLLVETGDTIFTQYRTRFGSMYTIFFKEDSAKEFNSSFINREYGDGESLTNQRYSLTQGIGLTSHSFEFDFGNVSETLKGAVINGVVYGDTTVTGIKEYKNVRLQYVLAQNYPNPFNPVTTINYSVPKTSFVTIKVYDVLGKEITTLVKEEKLSGNFKVEFNAGKLASGIYFYRMTAGASAGSATFMETKKLILLK